MAIWGRGISDVDPDEDVWVAPFQPGNRPGDALRGRGVEHDVGMVRANRLRQGERNTRQRGEAQSAIESLRDVHRSGLPELPGWRSPAAFRMWRRKAMNRS